MLPALAQNFSLDWSTIDAGGGTSSNGLYSLTGTIGQPDTGRMTGGNYSLEGGFWSLFAAIQTPGAPLLRVTRSGASVIVSWPASAADFILEETATLTGAPLPWMPVVLSRQTNAGIISVTVPTPAGTRFYRLHGP